MHTRLALAIVCLVAWMSCFVVDQTEFAVVFEMGKPKQVIKEPGLHFKAPFIQSVSYVSRKLEFYDSRPTDVFSQDKKPLMSDGMAAFRVVDPLLWITSVQNVTRAQSRVDDAVYSALRSLISGAAFDDVVGNGRGAIVAEALRMSNQPLKSVGMNVQMVGLKRIMLQRDAMGSVYERMRAERRSFASQYRSEGDEEAEKIRTDADRAGKTIVADARLEAAKVQGDAEAEAARLYTQAYSTNPELFKLITSIKVMREGLSNAKEARVILSGKEAFVGNLLN